MAFCREEDFLEVAEGNCLKRTASSAYRPTACRGSGIWQDPNRKTRHGERSYAKWKPETADVL